MDFVMMPIEKGEMETIKYVACLVVGPRDPKVCQPVAEALSAVGVAKPRLVTQVDRAEGVIARADAEGGAAIVVTWGGWGLQSPPSSRPYSPPASSPRVTDVERSRFAAASRTSRVTASVGAG